MNVLRRFVLIVSIVVTGSLALAAAAAAAGSPGGGGKGGPLGPGDYTFTDASASAMFGAPTAKGGLPQVLLNVDRNVSTFQPEDGQDTVTRATTVTLQMNTPAVKGFGCFNIAPSDFTVSKDLQNASLHTRLNVPCTGKAGGGGLPSSIMLDVTWVGTGVVGTSRNSGSFDCVGYTLARNFVARSADVSASGSVSLNSVSLWPQSPADSATVISSDVHTHILGVEPAACFALQVGA